MKDFAGFIGIFAVLVAVSWAICSTNDKNRVIMEQNTPKIIEVSDGTCTIYYGQRVSVIHQGTYYCTNGLIIIVR